jgi:aspartyl-tRNA synthetase
MKRTHTCGELKLRNENKKVTLNGWVDTRRDHGGVIFIDLRDRYGITQVAFSPEFNEEVHKEAEHLRREDVLEVHGIVKKRKEGMENKKLPTGEIEVFTNKLIILNKAETPPIEIDGRVEINEDMRLKYRYLDLRNPSMQNNLIIRHKTAKVVRDYFDKHNFIEIETPMLAKSTPEGARDYLVPSRVNPGTFFALPQSPQLFKQLLMVSGFDRYIQIVKCFRDEDLRADRQPEFTQIDAEMSFIDEEDIYTVMEGLMVDIWEKIMNTHIKTPFPRLTHKEAIERYGTDKPDTRFELELIDVSDIVKNSEFKVFADAVKSGGKVRCINAKGCAYFSRKDIDELTSFVAIYEAKGLAWMKYTDKLESSVVKFFDKDLQEKIIKKTKAEKDDLLLFVGDHKHFVVDTALGQLRLELARRLKLVDKTKFNFLWVTDFPLVEYDEDAQRHIAIHHPFTSPKDEHLELLDSNPLDVRAKAYDMTLNGVELGGGSIRIHKAELQEKMFKILGIGKQEAKQKFGFLLDAFKYGAPPHGGIAFGLDRLIAILTGNESIREVIAFPKTKAAESLMEGSPSEVDEKQLKELHVKLDFVKAQKKEVIFEKITDLLNKSNIEYEIIEHKPVYTSEEAAKVRGTSLDQGCKALICKTEKGFVQACVSGAKEIDLHKLKDVLNTKKIELATAEEVKELSGLSIGAVPPFGNLFQIEVYLDNSVLKNEHIAFNAALHTKSIRMKAKDLVKATQAKSADFSK